MAFPLFAPRRLLPGGDPDAGRALLPVNVRTAGPHARGREAAALLLWTAATFLALALGSYAGSPGPLAPGVTAPPVSWGPNWVGPAGELCARSLVTLLGLTAWAIPLEMMLIGIPFVRGKSSLVTPARLAGDLLLAVIASALVQVGWPLREAFGHHGASGLVGELFGELGRSLFSTIGSFLVGFASLGLILIARASFSFIATMQALGRWSTRGALGTAAGAKTVAAAWKTARELEREQDESAKIKSLPRIALDAPDLATIAVLPQEGEDAPPVVSLEAAEEGVAQDPPASKRRTRKKKDASPAPSDAVATDSAADPAPAVLEAPGGPPPPAARKERPGRASQEAAEPTIVDTSAALEKETVARGDAKREKAAEKPAGDRAQFRLPSIELLVPAKVDVALPVDKETLFKNAELLVKTLADYGVNGKVEDILPGPTVTTFEVSPEAGTKVSKVASLADDLALALARKVRIVAPIPGKNRIGFELPNAKRIAVTLRDLVEDRRFQTLDAPLPVVLGRDILGNPVYADLASMPHVIVAGATGAGKSVGLNVMLMSLLYRRSPRELRLLMIDPKVVELAPFDGIPHMLLPVVTDMKQAATALKWAVDEMERRYQLFADAGTKNIGTYNAWAGRVQRGEVRNPAAKLVLGKDASGAVIGVPPGEGEEGVAPLPETLPLIVIVVDEFADLMMQQGKEVEAAVARLAQKARAAGMHVILATQRPSVDVITGMIKANFPTRIAYRVSQKVDSRTILDEQGAEHLLGKGDMLIKLNGTNETMRVQCPMVSEEEVQAVTDFLRSQGVPVYDDNILKPRDDDDANKASDDDAEQDPMYDQAVQLVADTRRCSTSWLQRKLEIGYNRAARIVETMERRGLVGPANGAKDREVLLLSQ
jgi:S-DNA-T family DNA segregation ATPase FtsK/SpoIIIE